MKIPMLDIYAKAEIGKSLAGLTLGEKLETFIPFLDKTLDGNRIEWTMHLGLDNNGVLMYEIPNNNGYIIYISEPKLELGFTPRGKLCAIIAYNDYEGKILDGGIKMGCRLGDIECPIVLDDTEDVYYLSDGRGGIIEGIYFVADGLEVDDDPDQRITEVRVYDYCIE